MAWLPSFDPKRFDNQIEEDPFKPGAMNAVVAETGAPVWAIAPYFTAYDHDLRRIAAEFRLSLPAVEAALHFYKAYRADVDAKIHSNAGIG